MRYLPAFILSLVCIQASANNTIDTFGIGKDQLFCHKVADKTESNRKLIIYLHGGVSQFKGLTESVVTDVESLLEGNEAFVEQCQKRGFDLALPVSFNQYNWLEADGYSFLVVVTSYYRQFYDSIYMAGFSDGGTGAYRIFYSLHKEFKGLMVFNGYPQLKGYHRGVEYSNINKPVVFCSTTKDGVIPSEFLQVEYRRQQMLNKNTFFVMRDGKHAFTAYGKDDIDLCLDLLMSHDNSSEIPEDSVHIYPPIDGLIIDGRLVEVHPFKKGIGKSYGMSESEYARSDIDHKRLEKLLKKGIAIRVEPIVVSKKEFEDADTLQFILSIDGAETRFNLVNWHQVNPWN